MATLECHVHLFVFLCGENKERYIYPRGVHVTLSRLVVFNHWWVMVIIYAVGREMFSSHAFMYIINECEN